MRVPGCVSERVQNNSKPGWLTNKDASLKAPPPQLLDFSFKSISNVFIKNHYSAWTQTHWSQLSYSIWIRDYFGVTARESGLVTDLRPLTHLSDCEVKSYQRHQHLLGDIIETDSSGSVVEVLDFLEPTCTTHEEYFEDMQYVLF